MAKRMANQLYWKRFQERRQTDDRFNLRLRFRTMKQRCYNPNDQAYANYGARGITICKEWLDDPEVFIDWALANGFQIDLEIDRIDNDKGYSPDNCRFVLLQVQRRNTRFNVTDFERGTRVCEKCGVEKSLEEFHRDRTMPEGRKYICKICRRCKS